MRIYGKHDSLMTFALGKQESMEELNSLRVHKYGILKKFMYSHMIPYNLLQKQIINMLFLQSHPSRDVWIEIL